MLSPRQLGTRGSALALAQAEAVAAALGGAEVVPVKTDDARRSATRRASCAGSSPHCSTARSISASTPPRTFPASCPTGSRWSACPAARTRPTPRRRRRARSTSCRRGRPRRHREPPAALPAARRSAPTSRSWSCAATSIRAWRVAAGDYDAIVLAAAGLRRLGREDEIAFRVRAGEMTPAPGQGALWRSRSARTTRPREAAAAITDRAALASSPPSAPRSRVSRARLRHAGRGLRAHRGATLDLHGYAGAARRRGLGARPARGRPRTAGRARPGAGRADAGRRRSARSSSGRSRARERPAGNRLPGGRRARRPGPAHRPRARADRRRRLDPLRPADPGRGARRRARRRGALLRRQAPRRRRGCPGPDPPRAQRACPPRAASSD